MSTSELQPWNRTAKWISESKLITLFSFSSLANTQNYVLLADSEGDAFIGQ
jgi:hypothetical protein